MNETPTTAPSAIRDGAPMSATVVVATFNRPRELARLLAGLAVQDRPPHEVIVVDDGSTRPVDQGFAEESDVSYRLIRKTNGGPGSARHVGILEATSDVIVVIDDDMIVTPRLVASHMELHEAGFEVVQGRFSNTDTVDRPLFDRFVDEQQASYFDRCAKDPSAMIPVRLATGNVSFRRRHYLDVGGFDVTMRRREDSELGVKLALAGARFGHTDERTAEHDEKPEPFHRWLEVAEEYGAAAVEIDERHPGVVPPWALLDEMPRPIRSVVGAMAASPSSLRTLARIAGGVGRILDRLRLEDAGVRFFGVAYALSWFAGTASAMGPRARDELMEYRARSSGDCEVLFGAVAVDVVSLPDAVERILDLSDTDKVEIVVTPNVDHLVLYGRDPAFAHTYDRAGLVLADGMPLVLMSRLLRLPLRDKVSGSDLLAPLMASAAERGTRVFMLGSTEETTAEAERRLMLENPMLHIVGRSSPWYNSDDDAPDMRAALQQVAASGAQLVLMAFGAPKQEQILHTFEAALPPACYLCCGASLDFVAGRVQRAPAWMSRFGLEWTYRLVREPRRLWRRYIVRDAAALPLFGHMIVRRLSGRTLVRAAGAVAENEGSTGHG